MKRAAYILIGLAVFSLFIIFKENIKSTFIVDFNWGWVFSDLSVRFIILFSLAFSIYIWIGKSLKKWLGILISLVVSFTIGFIFHPIYADDYGVVKHVDQIDVNLVYEHFPELINYKQPYLVSFFTSTCPFCELAAINFNINKENQSQLKTVILFPSELADAQAFLERSNTKFDIGLISDDEFLKNSGPRFPSVFLVQKGKVLNHWVGSEINFSVLDYLKGLANN